MVDVDVGSSGIICNAEAPCVDSFHKLSLLGLRDVDLIGGLLNHIDRVHSNIQQNI